MIIAHGVEAVRRAEAAAMAALPEGALMQRAAAGLASVVARELRCRAGGVHGRRVMLLVGPGSNGGDALWAGARLAARGAAVCAVLTSGRVHREGLAALLAAGGRVVDAAGPNHGRGDAQHPIDERGDALRPRGLSTELTTADVVVDGLVGIGGRPGLSGVAADAARNLADDTTVVAVDLPSGVDPDSGELAGTAVHADITVTFGTAKPCLLLPPADRAAGRVVVLDIGLDPEKLGAPAVTSLEQGDVAGRWPVPTTGDDKYSRGVVGVVAGGATYTGAAVLCSGAAVRAGAGMVRYVGPRPPTDLVRQQWPEVVPGRGRVQAWALGSGVDPAEDDQADAVRAALGGDVPCVVDAGALEVLAAVLIARRRPLDGPLLLTPHAGELARLLASLPGDLSDPGASTPYVGLTREQVEARPLHHARAAARVTGATVLLKGATTLIVAPDGTTRAQPDGPHWLATAGSGDVLTGIAGVLLAARLDPLDAGSMAVAVHGRAGALASGGGPVSASAVLDAVPHAVAALLRAGTAPALPDWFP